MVLSCPRVVYLGGFSLLRFFGWNMLKPFFPKFHEMRLIQSLRCPRKTHIQPELSLCSRDDTKQQQRIQTLENLTGGYLEILVCHVISLRRILLCDSCNLTVHHAWLIWSFQIRRLDMVGECGWQDGLHVLFIVKYWLVWNTVLLHDADDLSTLRWM